MSRPDYTEILQRIASGQTDEIAALAERYERELLGLALGLTGSADLAEEVVQDTWVRVLRSAKTFEGRSQVRTWLYRIVINRSRDVRRREARLSNRSAAVAAAIPDQVFEDDRRRIRQAIRSLPDQWREPLLLCHHADLTHVQAAEILGIPLGTLKTRIRAARKKLQHIFVEEVMS